MISITKKQNNNNLSFPLNTAATLAGAAVFYSSFQGADILSDVFNSHALISDVTDFERTKNAYMSAFDAAKLKEKGVKTFFVPLAIGKDDTEKMNNILDIISDLDSHPEDEKVLNALYPQDKDTIYTRFCDKCEQILRKNPNNRILKKTADYLFGAEDAEEILWQLDDYIEIKYADNALFLTKSNSIIVPDCDVSTHFFHEMGHAINYNLKKTGKFLSNLSCLKFDAAIALGAAAILLPSQKGKEEKNKPIDFLQRNVGKLAFISTLPLLLEEFRASYNGLKAAKPFLNKSDYIKYRNSYFNGFMGYFLTSVCLAAGAFTAVKIKNIIAQKIKKKSKKPFFAKEKSCTDSAQSGEQNNINKTVGAFSKRQGYVHSPKTAKHGRD